MEARSYNGPFFALHGIDPLRVVPGKRAPEGVKPLTQFSRQRNHLLRNLFQGKVLRIYHGIGPFI